MSRPSRRNTGLTRTTSPPSTPSGCVHPNTASRSGTGTVPPPDRSGLGTVPPRRIGDSPSPGSIASSAAIGPKETRTSGDGDSPRRPPVGFMLDDAEMLARLRYLYGGKRVDDIAEEWARLRRNGLGNLVDERKRRY